MQNTQPHTRPRCESPVSDIAGSCNAKFETNFGICARVDMWAWESVRQASQHWWRAQRVRYCLSSTSRLVSRPPGALHLHAHGNGESILGCCVPSSTPSHGVLPLSFAVAGVAQNITVPAREKPWRQYQHHPRLHTAVAKAALTYSKASTAPMQSLSLNFLCARSKMASVPTATPTVSSPSRAMAWAAWDESLHVGAANST